MTEQQGTPFHCGSRRETGGVGRFIFINHISKYLCAYLGLGTVGVLPSQTHSTIGVTRMPGKRAELSEGSNPQTPAPAGAAHSRCLHGINGHVTTTVSLPCIMKMREDGLFTSTASWLEGG